MKEHFKQIFIKHLDTLYSEVSSFENEKQLWAQKEGVQNCAGNLALHLVGSLNHFIGSVLGKSGFVRDRESEFNQKNLLKSEILFSILSCKQEVEKTFSKLKDVNLFEPYPLNLFGEGKTVNEVLLILLGHFNYHLGQINYFRRLK